MAAVIHLVGRVFIRGNILLKTGLHIGGSDTGLTIGAINNVIVDSLSGQPYIPGSSLKGKMRSLTEKYMGLPLVEHAGVDHMHTVEIYSTDPAEIAQARADYFASPVAQIYGVPAQAYNAPTRLVVRDVQLRPESALELLDARTDLPYTEVKTEVSIDRITSQANPRSVERVPAGARFGEMVLIYNLYQHYDLTDGNANFFEGHFGVDNDISLLETVLWGMALLEDDYLGGLGSRGSGQIGFEDLYLTLKLTSDYGNEIPLLDTSRANPKTLFDVFQQRTELANQLRQLTGVA